MYEVICQVCIFQYIESQKVGLTSLEKLFCIDKWIIKLTYDSFNQVEKKCLFHLNDGRIFYVHIQKSIIFSILTEHRMATKSVLNSSLRTFRSLCEIKDATIDNIAAIKE